MKRFRHSLFRIKTDLLFDGPAAYGTEIVHTERIHHTIRTRTVNPFRHIAATFVNPHLIRILFIHRCRNRRSFLDQIFPFPVEIDQSSQIRFPGLHIGRKQIAICRTAHIFIAQPQKQVAEFMCVDFCI